MKTKISQSIYFPPNQQCICRTFKMSFQDCTNIISGEICMMVCRNFHTWHFVQLLHPSIFSFWIFTPPFSLPSISSASVVDAKCLSRIPSTFSCTVSGEIYPTVCRTVQYLILPLIWCTTIPCYDFRIHNLSPLFSISIATVVQ